MICDVIWRNDMTPQKTLIWLSVAIPIAIVLVSFFWPLTQLRSQLFLNGSNVPMAVLVGMKLRGHNIREITDAHIALLKSGTIIPLDQLEALAASGGDVPQCAKAMIEAEKAAQEIPFATIAAVDLAAKAEGRTVLDMVRNIANTKTLICPPPDGVVPYIETATQDGVSLRGRATVVVRGTLQKYIGGSSEEALIAAVCEKAATLIGQQPTSQLVLSNPKSISDKLKASGLDSMSMYEIQSITVALWTGEKETR
jgi:uncharacterized protein YqfA (UPF0365 family)